MTTQNRANEILSQITAFSKTGYTKAEYLPELMKLQDEVRCRLIHLYVSAERWSSNAIELTF